MTDTTRTEDNPAHEAVLAIHGHKFADLWLAGRASPRGDQRFQWLVLRLGGSMVPGWFDTEETAREFVEYQKYLAGPMYIAKTVAVSESKTSREWSVFE